MKDYYNPSQYIYIYYDIKLNKWRGIITNG